MGISNDQFGQRVQSFLQCAQGSRYDKVAIVYEWILEAEDPKAALTFFFENADYINSSEEKEIDPYFTAQQLRKCELEYKELIDGLLNKLVSRHYEKEKFYNELWESVVGSDLLFGEEQAKIYALGKIWSDTRIPYFQIDPGLKMSNEEYSGILESKKELLQEVLFILGCRYEQKTEVSSILLGVLDRCDNPNEKAVVMAKIMDFIEKRTVINMINKQ